MSSSHTFWISGLPAPKGSTRAFVVKGRAVTTQANKATRPWMALVVDAAKTSGHFGLVGPYNRSVAIRLEVEFYFPRPKGHYRSDGVRLRQSAPAYMTTKPDVDKLERAILDALTGVAYHDDSQVVEQSSKKLYTSDGPVGAMVTVEALR